MRGSQSHMTCCFAKAIELSGSCHDHEVFQRHLEDQPMEAGSQVWWVCIVGRDTVLQLERASIGFIAQIDRF